MQTVFSQRTLQVHLLRYENPFNVEVRSGNPNTPICCCNTLTPCYPSVKNFSLHMCATACQLQFTVCARIHSTGEEKCMTSAIEPAGFPDIVFSDQSSLFPDAFLQLLLDFELDTLSLSVS